MTLVRLLLPVLFLPVAARAGDRPNIIFILADDLGYTDVSSYGSKYYETPNIDRLAAEGLKFTNGYSNGPNCQPTRAALISGQYGPRTGIYTVGNIDRFNWRSQALRPADNATTLPAEKITIAQALKGAGYATGLFGKWHLGNGPEAHPSKRGFDEAIVSNGKHFDFATDPKVSYPEGTYLADFITDKAVDFIERHKDGPFFLYVPHFGVHAPYQAKPELIAKFKAKPVAGGHRDPVYAAMLASVDESVGRITTKLDQLGLAQNTVVIFSSDNGGIGGYQREGIQAKDTTDNAPLKAGKGSLHEGGIRVPYIFRWKGTIPSGSVSTQPIASIDLYPSTLELAKAKKPGNHVLDGVSYAAHLKDPANTKVERDALFWHFPGYLGAGNNTWRTKPVSVVRRGPWKLIQSLDDRSLQLYNLDEDLGEKTNLAASQPEKAKELLAKLDTWRDGIKAPLPTKNEPQDTPAGGGKRKKRNK
jgi:arylsulfatase A-like enzyme